jgi:hypothetical protein
MARREHAVKTQEGKTDLLACLHDGQVARAIALLEERLRNAKRK